MRPSYLQAAAGALTFAVVAGLVFLPARLLAPSGDSTWALTLPVTTSLGPVLAVLPSPPKMSQPRAPRRVAVVSHYQLASVVTADPKPAAPKRTTHTVAVAFVPVARHPRVVTDAVRPAPAPAHTPAPAPAPAPVAASAPATTLSATTPAAAPPAAPTPVKTPAPAPTPPDHGKGHDHGGHDHGHGHDH
jgi:hypothetical protein